MVTAARPGACAPRRDPRKRLRYNFVVSDYRDERVGLRRRVEELEERLERLRKLMEEHGQIEAPESFGTEVADLFNDTRSRVRQFVGGLISGRRTTAPRETGILRARIARLEERISQAEATLEPYRWPRKTSPFYEEASSHEHSDNTEMDSAAREPADEAPGQGGHGRS